MTGIPSVSSNSTSVFAHHSNGHGNST